MLKEKNGCLGLPDLANGLSRETGAKSLPKTLNIGNSESFFQHGKQGLCAGVGKGQ